MTKEQKDEITKISKEFASGFKDMFGNINGTGWLIADPLSGFLNSIGFENTMQQIPETEKNHQVIILTFKDGSQFIPAGGDLRRVCRGAKNWSWIDPENTLN